MLISRFVKRTAFAAFLIVTLISTAWFASLTVYRGEPIPVYHDEFSYLFAADTFSHFRFTNPVLKFRDHFRTFHILSEPTTMSRYPPGQALFLAFGKLTTGLPIAGAILSVALACGVFAWCLFPLTGFVWSVIGGLAMAASPLMVEWTRNYWGGGVATLGSALVLGSLLHAYLGSRGRSLGLALGLGLFLLVITRPVEGFFFTAPLIIGGGWLTFRKSRAGFIRGLIGPAVFVLGIAGSWLAYYQYRVTGSPFVMPAQAYVKSYSEAPPFVFLGRNVPTITPVLQVERDFNAWELNAWQIAQTWDGYVRVFEEKLKRIEPLFPKPILLFLPLILGGFFLLGSFGWVLLASCLSYFVCFAIETFFSIHYAAPIVPAIFFMVTVVIRWLTTQCLDGHGWWDRARRLSLRRDWGRSWSWRRSGAEVGSSADNGNPRRIWRLKERCQQIQVRYGSYIGFSLMIAWMASSVIQVLNTEPAVPGNWSIRRVELLDQLRKVPDKRFLLIVRYGEHYNFHEEWVYNEANLDDSKVIFARDLGAEKNRQLIAHYSDRRVLLLTFTENALRIEGY